MLVDADGDLHELAAVLVPHVDAVLARVLGRDLVDDHAGKLATVKCDPGVLVGDNLLLVLEPGDLRSRLATHCAGQAQGLREEKNKPHVNQYLETETSRSHVGCRSLIWRKKSSPVF